VAGPAGCWLGTERSRRPDRSPPAASRDPLPSLPHSPARAHRRGMIAAIRCRLIPYSPSQRRSLAVSGCGGGCSCAYWQQGGRPWPAARGWPARIFCGCFLPFFGSDPARITVLPGLCWQSPAGGARQPGSTQAPITYVSASTDVQLPARRLCARPRPRLAQRPRCCDARGMRGLLGVWRCVSVSRSRLCIARPASSLVRAWLRVQSPFPWLYWLLVDARQHSASRWTPSERITCAGDATLRDPAARYASRSDTLCVWPPIRADQPLPLRTPSESGPRAYRVRGLIASASSHLLLARLSYAVRMFGHRSREDSVVESALVAATRYSYGIQSIGIADSICDSLVLGKGQNRFRLFWGCSAKTPGLASIGRLEPSIQPTRSNNCNPATVLQGVHSRRVDRSLPKSRRSTSGAPPRGDR